VGKIIGLPGRQKKKPPEAMMPEAVVAASSPSSALGLDAPPDGAAVGGIDERQAMIAEAAYFRAEHRGFQAGHEMEDWLAAEQDIERGPRRGSDANEHALPE